MVYNEILLYKITYTQTTLSLYVSIYLYHILKQFSEKFSMELL